MIPFAAAALARVGNGLPRTAAPSTPGATTPAAAPAVPGTPSLAVGATAPRVPPPRPVGAATIPNSLAGSGVTGAPVAYGGATGYPPAPPSAPAAPPAGAGTPGAALGAYGPGSDLQGTAITPTNSALTDQAQGTVASGLSALSNLPNRTALAQGNMSLLQQQIGDEQKTGLRDIGQQAAALGRVGSGMTTSAYGDLADRLDVEQQRAASGLALDAASGQASDAEGRLSAGQSVYNQSAGIDANNRAELRTERGYQTGQAQTAYNQQVQQTTLGDQLQNSALGRAIQEWQAGSSSALQGAYGQAANTAGAAGSQAMGAGAGLLGQYAFNQATNGGTGAPGQVPAGTGFTPNYQLPGLNTTPQLPTQLGAGYGSGFNY